MSEKTARATRRQLRRAVGPEALAVVAHHEEALRSIPEQVTAALSEQKREWRSEVQDLYETLAMIDHDRVWLRLSFWSRVRWFLTGRIAPRITR